MSAFPHHPGGELPPTFHWDGHRWVETLPGQPPTGWQPPAHTLPPGVAPPYGHGLDYAQGVAGHHPAAIPAFHPTAAELDAAASAAAAAAAMPGAPAALPGVHPSYAATPMTTFAAVQSPGALPMAPAVRDPQRTALAAVITFVAAVVGLWAILGYVHDLSVALSSVSSSNGKLIQQMTVANEGLDQLDDKTAKVQSMNDYSKRLATLMEQIDADMGGMVTSVDGIGTQMSTTSGALRALDGELTGVAAADASMAKTLVGIDKGLRSQSEQVRTMRKDLHATARVIEHIPSTLRATNERLAFINRVVCQIGARGLGNRLALAIEFLGITTGRATIHATMIPAGGWRC